MATLELVALVVREYEPAIRFFVDVLQFELVEDTPSLTNDGRPKRWVVVRPAGAQTGILLARADGEHQVNIIGQQFAGRVGFFLRVEDFEASYQRMLKAAVRFVSGPRTEPYGKVAVFLDLEGNRMGLTRPGSTNSVQIGGQKHFRILPINTCRPSGCPVTFSQLAPTAVGSQWPYRRRFSRTPFGQVHDRFGINWMILHQRPMRPQA
jgi:catechol 2,3-dioxygenase-like lactoylglutathione lyase family enzyme